MNKIPSPKNTLGTPDREKLEKLLDDFNSGRLSERAEAYKQSDEYKKELESVRKSIKRRKRMEVFRYLFVEHIWDLIIVVIALATLLITIFK